MAGFASQYAEITRVEWPDGFFARVRKYLKRGDYKAAQQVLVSPIMRVGSDGDDADGERQTRSETTGAVDSGGYQDELVARALIEWNLTDEDGNLVPLGVNDPLKGPDATRRAAVAWLPQDAFEKILEAIDGSQRRGRRGGKGDGPEADPFRPVGEEGAVPGGATTA